MISFFKRISLYDEIYKFDRRKKCTSSAFDQILETDRHIMNNFCVFLVNLMIGLFFS